MMYDLGWNIIKTTFDFAAALCYAITVKPKGARYLNLFDIQRKTIRAVKQAARIFRKGAATVAEKGNATNLVTDADVAIQRFLQHRLQKVLTQAGFLAEEENLQRTGDEYLWVIDPIDGTANFSRNIPNCLISVALVRNGEAVLAVCYAPNLNLLFTAIKGEGAFCNGKRIHTSDKDFSHSLFCTSLTPYQKNLANICSGIMLKVYPLCSDFRRFGSCALELCYLAMGVCDLYFEMRVCPWDYAAAALVLTEAGGIIRGYDGEPLTYDKKTVLVAANNEENYQKLNSIITEGIKEPIIFEE